MTVHPKLQTLYGLKFHPFRPDVPIEALLATSTVETFLRRVELGIADGGFAMVTGDPSTGKSVALRLLSERLRGPLVVDYAARDELCPCIDHLREAAGAPALMTTELKATLAEHAAGNYRVLMTLADELLAVAVDRELPRLDEKLFLEHFQPTG